MKVSFFCRHCGLHLRKGNHAACKKLLRAEQRKSEEARLADGKRQGERYASGDTGKYLVDFEKLS